jgi:hypothetical protein
VSATFYPITTLPAPYDIVWCLFPEHVDLGHLGPKPRPGIVLNVAVHEDGAGDAQGEVQVIYGTGKLKLMQRRQDFFVTNMAEMDVCGLHKATRFDLDTVAWLPWSREWFETLPTYDSPIIGHLSHHATKLLQIQLSYRRKAQPQLILEGGSNN